MARAKVYCEVTCNRCGVLALGSGYYKNSSRISYLKAKTKDWVWDNKFGGNLCPSCQMEYKEECKNER